MFVLSWARVRRVRRGNISSELLVCSGGVRSILLLPLVARCLETIDVCINSLNNSSHGWNVITAKLVKRVLIYYIKPLTFPVNQSFHYGIFPGELTLAKGIPIYKSESIMGLCNYRPYQYLT